MEPRLTSGKLDLFFRGFLDIAAFEGSDNSLNGLQVGNSGGEIGKIAFAVDASLETIRRAAAAGAGMLFVHHGLFWGRSLAVTGVHRERLKALLDNDLCLYAVHLPLDQHLELGNNAVLAGLLGLQDIEPFGAYHGRKIGYKGKFPRPLTVDQAVRKIAFEDRPPTGIFPFGKSENTTCAVVSGGAAANAPEAIAEGIDLFVTGEMLHFVYGECLEGRMNMIAAGHYSSEVWGVRAVMERCAGELGIETVFIDVPTGL
ncbi:MAG: Nif3-like dinuclear metal center hexameric protein [Treponema sp.]|nr:Nif3-like dinuclear metal center hexameric protein [Treponema sp.]